MKVLLVILLPFFSAAQSIRLDQLIEAEWNAFKLKHKKDYTNKVEELYRMKIFIENKYAIAEHNAKFIIGMVSYKMGLNEYSDMLPHEMAQLMSGFEINQNNKFKSTRISIGASFMSPANVELPMKIDWRKLGAVTPVKNQGNCGSCWAFSAIGSLEGQFYRSVGHLVPLSEQNLVDCAKSERYSAHGCAGGSMESAFQYIEDNGGVNTGQIYPYEGRDNSSCRFDPRNIGAGIVGFVKIPEGDEEKLKAAVATVGSISVGIDMDHRSFALYSGGVYEEPKCRSNELSHAVLLVGYGTDKSGKDYWLIKNSWGTSWARHRLYEDPTCAYLINIAVSEIVKCVFVLPITLAVLLVRNWIFGQFLCYFLPMLQDIPIHVSMMTYLLIAGDRYRLVSDPGKPRIPAFVCSIGAWFFAVCIVLPFPVYTTYLDLESYKNRHFQGLGMCIANLADDIQQYIRGLFLLTYIAPLTIIAYLYVKASTELQNQEEPMAVAMFQSRAKRSYSRHDSNNSNDLTSIRDGKRESGSVVTGGTVGLSRLSHTYDLYDAELDVQKEQRTQKYLIFMVSVFATVLCPLMLLKLAKLALVETYENSGHFDITFTMFVWLAFSSTVTTPALYTSWQMSRPAKERLKGYFQFSNKRLARVCEESVGRPKRNQQRHSSGLVLANVAYQQTRGGSLNGSTSGGESFRGNPTYHSPDLGKSAHRMNLVQ